MKILKTYDDGSQTVLFEPGDRVQLINYLNDWIAKSGEYGTVIRYVSNHQNPDSITFLEVQTDGMKEEGWGVITVPPWNLTLKEEGGQTC